MKKKNNNILRIVVVAFLVISMLMWLLPLSPSFAQHQGGIGIASAEEHVSEEELEDSSERAPKILPTNTFYFLKDWGRGLRQFFTFNKVNKASYELKVSEERLAELKALIEADPENSEGVENAIENYERTVERLNERIERITEKNTERVDEFLDRLTEKSLNAQSSLEDLKTKREDVRDSIEEAQDIVDEVIIQIPDKFDDSEKFRNRIIRTIESSNGENAELERAGALFRLEAKTSSDESRKSLDSVKEDLLLRFEGRVNSEEITQEEIRERINNLNINETLKIKIIDRLREDAENPRLRSALNEIRPNVISQFDFRDDSEREANAEKAIAQAEELVEKLNLMIDSGEFSASRAVDEHLKKAEFALDDARVLFNNGEYGAAFGQANSSAVVARAGISLLQRSEEDISENVDSFKLRFDRLMEVANRLELNRENQPDLFELFDTAERLILSVSDVSDGESIRRILAEIEVVISKLRRAGS